MNAVTAKMMPTTIITQELSTKASLIVSEITEVLESGPFGS